MNGIFSIDFRCDDGAVGRMLATVDEAGLSLRGIRLIPAAAGERMTLRLELDGRGEGELQRLVQRLRALEAVIDVIHKAGMDARPVASDRPAA